MVDDFGDVWNWEENKLFEMALATFDWRHPHYWKTMAALVGRWKSCQQVHRNYMLLQPYRTYPLSLVKLEHVLHPPTQEQPQPSHVNVEVWIQKFDSFQSPQLRQISIHEYGGLNGSHIIIVQGNKRHLYIDFRMGSPGSISCLCDSSPL